MGCEFSSSTFVLDLQILKLLGKSEAGHVQLNLWVYLFILPPPLELHLNRGTEESLCETWSIYGTLRSLRSLFSHAGPVTIL